jgi:hypothetical protein
MVFGETNGVELLAVLPACHYLRHFAALVATLFGVALFYVAAPAVSPVVPGYRLSAAPFVLGTIIENMCRSAEKAEAREREERAARSAASLEPTGYTVSS